MWEQVYKIQKLMDYIGEIHSIIDDSYMREMIPIELREEVKSKTREWKGLIYEKFDEYFIKQANLVILTRKEKEIRDD